jgi:hypothetical protein
MSDLVPCPDHHRGTSLRCCSPWIRASFGYSWMPPLLLRVAKNGRPPSILANVVQAPPLLLPTWRWTPLRGDTPYGLYVQHWATHGPHLCVP